MLPVVWCEFCAAHTAVMAALLLLSPYCTNIILFMKTCRNDLDSGPPPDLCQAPPSATFLHFCFLQKLSHNPAVWKDISWCGWGGSGGAIIHHAGRLEWPQWSTPAQRLSARALVFHFFPHTLQVGSLSLPRLTLSSFGMLCLSWSLAQKTKKKGKRAKPLTSSTRHHRLLCFVFSSKDALTL